jgi:hypothetical protein
MLFFLIMHYYKELNHYNDVSCRSKEVLKKMDISFHSLLKRRSIPPEIICQYIRFTRQRGERDLTYMMITRFYLSSPDIAIPFIRNLVGRDIICVCIYSRSIAKQLFHQMIDMIHIQLEKKNASLSRWIPREHSRHSWLFYYLALDWGKRKYPYMFSSSSSLSSSSKRKRNLFCYRTFRLLLSSCKTCGTYNNSFCENHTLSGSSVRRILHGGGGDEGVSSGGMSVSSGNSGWNLYKKYMGVSSGYIIPILDISLSMSCSPHLYDVIGLSCWIAMKSLNRIMTIDYHPSWISLEDCPTIHEKIQKIYSYAVKHGGTHFHLSETIQLIIQTILITQLSDKHISQLTFIVFSNTKSVQCVDSTKTMIHTMFHDLGISVVPTFIFSIYDCLS